jgi:type IV secretory pathway VirB2 component (pilin)
LLVLLQTIAIGIQWIQGRRTHNFRVSWIGSAAPSRL